MNSERKKSVAVFGEILLRLDTPEHQRIVQADSLGVSFTGGEANVGVALAQWGEVSSMISTVPDNAIGQAAENFLRRYGVNTQGIIRSGKRLGILYVETGAGQRASQVVYDRDATGFRELQPGLFNWEELLSETTIFHFTGTAPVSEGTRQTLFEALDFAKENNVLVSFDASFRSKLWSLDEARDVFLELMPYVDIFHGSESDASTFFGVPDTGDTSMTVLAERYGLEWVAFTDRSIDEVGRNFYSARLFHESSVVKSVSYETVTVDRIGTGDAFAAGILSGILRENTPQKIVDFATAAAVLKHTIPGDFALIPEDEIRSLMAGDSIGRVKR